MENDYYHVFQLLFPASALGTESAAEESVSCPCGRLCSLGGQCVAKSPAPSRKQPPAAPAWLPVTAASGLPPQELPSLPSPWLLLGSFYKDLGQLTVII